MKLDADTRSLQFSSEEELQRFHDDLTELIRVATVSVTKNVEVEVATERARELMRRHATVLRCLNQLRRVLPRHASGVDDHKVAPERGDPPDET
ncbi:MAG: hypothetical protein U0326_01600 [Polyangiales bacterium]